jgi:hypothetical protein
VAVTERYVYGTNQNIDLIFDEYGNVNHRYLFGNGVDQIDADESNGNIGINTVYIQVRFRLVV